MPLGRSLFASWNPIRTRGPMQVNVAFAEQFASERPYPYPVKVSIADEVFTRRGSVYFGTAHCWTIRHPMIGTCIASRTSMRANTRAATRLSRALFIHRVRHPLGSRWSAAPAR